MSQNQYGYYRTNPNYGFQQPYYGGTGQAPGTTFPQIPPGSTFPPGGATPPSTTGLQVPGMLPIEQSYIENILRLNKGKLVTVYATFENNREWNAKIFKGLIEAAGRDHLILSDPQSGVRYLIPMVYVDYVEFSEEIEYEFPFGGVPGGTSSYPPR